MCHFLPVHPLGMAFLAGSKGQSTTVRHIFGTYWEIEIWFNFCFWINFPLWSVFSITCFFLVLLTKKAKENEEHEPKQEWNVAF